MLPFVSRGQSLKDSEEPLFTDDLHRPDWISQAKINNCGYNLDKVKNYKNWNWASFGICSEIKDAELN